MRGYLLRLLVFSLVLGALPTVFIGIVSYYIAAGDIEKKVSEGNMQLLSQTQMRVEQSLKSLEMSATQFVSSSRVKTAMNETLTPGEFPEVRELSAELSHLQTEAVIKQAYLVNIDRDWAVSLGMLYKLSAMEQRREFTAYAMHPSSIFWSTRSAPVPVSSSGVSPGVETVAATTETVTLVHKIPLLPRSAAPKGLLVVHLAKDDIRGLLAPKNRLGNNYVLDASGLAFLATPEEQAQLGDINRRIADLAGSPGGRTGFFHAEAGGEKVSVLYRTSGYNGWTYVSLISQAEITKEPKKIALITGAACALILLLVLVFAYVGSRRMYSPIRSLLEYSRGLTPERPEEVRDGGDELAYIRQSLQSLAVSRSQLQERMEGQAGHLKEFFVLKLFTGQISTNDVEYRSQMYGFPQGWKRLGVLTLAIDNLQETRYAEEDRELLLFAVNNIVGELLPPASRFSPILLDETQVTLLASQTEEPEALKEEFYRTAEAIRTHVESYLQLQVSIGISQPFMKLSGTVKAYGESLDALKCRISLGPEIIVRYEDIARHEGSGTTVYAHLKVLEEQLVQALREMQPERASAVFDQYLSAVLHKDSFTQEHHLLLLQLMSRLMLLVQDQGVPLRKVLEGDSAVERLMRLRTREEISVWFATRLFAPIIALLSEKNESQYVNIADRLVGMIHEGYDGDITLESCAAELNFHPVYLSRVFKREMGVPFSDYLSEYRMNMAKVLLETTTLKISEVGEKLQYKNISAFIRSFRKTFGMTPGQYRDLIDQQG
ncbi:AraC family transcriptional regulator [Paenibacillus mucilaginosus]|uniref:Transcriptional regulator, AraC family n=1 Tax=Paenibacillus mucilaginosus (strain KNP414) TaxID=1036673 RepID=F8FGI2_PAEMK|nr:AraC family transcriptional regulator [Paenibacillus mucilaginosus]AEI44642.1 transcriptional regulator, AraC family [Paenibacillus mucilaginosus KNP414]MCG7215574.1 AraC family transcriptional regulator [Paenibacillus mucilaginosus]WDM26203.1 AraC family transcriptional regulator [Paenibacillus mucilaginosus]